MRQREPAVMVQVHGDDSFLRLIKAAGVPATSRTLPVDLPHPDLDARYRIAAAWTPVPLTRVTVAISAV